MIIQNNMLIRPTEEELATFGEPDFIIYNAGQFPANRFTKGMSSTTSVEINFKRMEMVILGTEYAGEMKKGVFSVMVSTLSRRLPPAPKLTLLYYAALLAARQVWTALSTFVRKRGHREGRCDTLLRSVGNGKDDAQC
jgi:ATP-dependent phosphoenolpyruvate carboxykinase